MANFLITASEEVIYNFFVEADSKEEAEELARFVDVESMQIVDGFDFTVREVKEVE